MNTFDIFGHFNKIGETFADTVAEAMMHRLQVVSLVGTVSYPQTQYTVLGQVPEFAAPAQGPKLNCYD